MPKYKHGSYFCDEELPTPKQIRAAMTVTGMGYRELAQQAGTSTCTLLWFLKRRRGISPQIVQDMRHVFECQGVRFTFDKRPGITFESDRICRLLRP